MVTRIWVGTRKGLFCVEKQGGTWRIESRGFLGVPVSMVLFDWRSENWFAGVKHGHFGPKLHRSSDVGKSWIELESPKQTPALARALGVSGPNGAVCLEIPVGKDFPSELAAPQ